MTQSTAKAMRVMRIIAVILPVNGERTVTRSLRSAARTQAESLDGETYPSRPHRTGKSMFKDLLANDPPTGICSKPTSPRWPPFPGSMVVLEGLSVNCFSIPVPLTQPPQEMFAILQDYVKPIRRDRHVVFPYLISLGKFAELSKRESGFDSFRSGLFFCRFCRFCA